MAKVYDAYKKNDFSIDFKSLDLSLWERMVASVIRRVTPDGQELEFEKRYHKFGPTLHKSLHRRPTEEERAFQREKAAENEAVTERDFDIRKALKGHFDLSDPQSMATFKETFNAPHMQPQDMIDIFMKKSLALGQGGGNYFSSDMSAWEDSLFRKVTGDIQTLGNEGLQRAYIDAIASNPNFLKDLTSDFKEIPKESGFWGGVKYAFSSHLSHMDLGDNEVSAVLDSALASNNPGDIARLTNAFEHMAQNPNMRLDDALKQAGIEVFNDKRVDPAMDTWAHSMAPEEPRRVEGPARAEEPSRAEGPQSSNDDVYKNFFGNPGDMKMIFSNEAHGVGRGMVLTLPTSPEPALTQAKSPILEILGRG